MEQFFDRVARISTQMQFDAGGRRRDTCNYKRGGGGKNCISLESWFVSMLIRGNSGYACSPAITCTIYPNVITRYHDGTTINDLDDVRSYILNIYIYTRGCPRVIAMHEGLTGRLLASCLLVEASFGKPRSNQFRVTAGRKKPPLLVALQRKKGTKLLKFWYQRDRRRLAGNN